MPIPRLFCRPVAGSFRSLVLVLAALPGAGMATPYVPRHDRVIVERLPASLGDARRLATLRAELAADPDDLGRATAMAWQAVRLARREADPRPLGYAQAALAPWWGQRLAPPEVLLLRATIRQSRHEYGAALADLDRLLQIQPRHAQALLTKATVQQVTGDYAGARRSCAALFWLTDELVASTCLSAVLSLTGEAERAYGLLHAMLTRNREGASETRQWALTHLAEMAVRLGRTEAAETHFREALAIGRRDIYLLSTYADFLLQQKRHREVVALLAGETAVDVLLVRLVLAEQRLGSPAFARHAAELRQRFAAARRRNDRVHEAAQARFLLHVGRDPGAALELARRNWSRQREPGDARLLLAAAIAANDPEAAAMVERWVQRTGLEDVRLDALIHPSRPVRPAAHH